MSKGLPLGNRSRRNRHILVMSPDPKEQNLWQSVLLRVVSMNVSATPIKV